MARGGISKVSVEKARKSLIGRGENPSIDAVRHELGNTGSKSTIHKYLKEIEAVESATVDDVDLLSAPIRDLITTLARQIHSEATDRIENADAQASEKLSQVRSENKALDSRLETLLVEHNELKTVHSASLETIDKLRSASTTLSTEKDKLAAVIDEKIALTNSLEDKIQRSYAAQEHYRESVRVQRDQELQKHEETVVQLQAELRRSKEVVALKQDELSKVAQDNARLASEFREKSTQLRQLESEISQLHVCARTAAGEISTLEAKLEQETSRSHQLRDRIDISEGLLNDAELRYQELLLKAAHHASEAQIKSELLNQFTPRREKPTS